MPLTPESAMDTEPPQPPAPETPAVPQASAGELLREAREAAGVQLGSLAVALKVSIKKLEALEADRFDLLPDAVFVRGLASSVCRALKVDPAAILQRLPQTATPRLEFEDVGLNEPFQMPGDVAKISIWDRVSRPMVLASLAILAAALVLIFFPSREQREEMKSMVAASMSGATTVPDSPPPTPGINPVGPAETGVEPQAATGAAPAAASKAAAAAPDAAAVAAPKAALTAAGAQAPAKAAAAPAKATAAAAPAPAAAGAETEAARKKLPSTGIVVFKGRGQSWIEVTDANGKVQVSRMLEEGDQVGASGALPLSVVIGRAEVTEVQVRGQPFDLGRVTREGVARFEVK